MIYTSRFANGNKDRFFHLKLSSMRQGSFQISLTHNANGTHTQTVRVKLSNSAKSNLIDQIGDDSVPVGISRVVHHVTGQPGMVENVFAGKPQLRIGLQHVDYQVPHAVTDVVPVWCGEVKESI